MSLGLFRRRCLCLLHLIYMAKRGRAEDELARECSPSAALTDLTAFVDPIDGTRDYVRGRTGWAVSVALVSAGKPLIGILIAPARGEEWVAEAGKGASLVMLSPARPSPWVMHAKTYVMGMSWW